MPSETGASAQARSDLPDAAIRAQLERILASEVFSRSPQLRRFLSFIVEQRLAGQGHTLKESVLAHELYGKGTDFDGGTDPVVRVDARRLRDKLREYYEGRADPVVISLPKGSYVPVFEGNSASRTPVTVRLLYQRCKRHVRSPFRGRGEARRRSRPSASLPTLMSRWIGPQPLIVPAGKGRSLRYVTSCFMGVVTVWLLGRVAGFARRIERADAIAVGRSTGDSGVGETGDVRGGRDLRPRTVRQVLALDDEAASRYSSCPSHVRLHGRHNRRRWR